jgi:multiple sugar transport system ATP-binding protein
MNFVRGKLELLETGVALRFGDQLLHLPSASQEARQYLGQEVIAGIRPESLRSGAGSSSISGLVDVLEPTGPDTMAIVNVGGQLVTARLGARERPAAGERISLLAESAAISLFDPKTESRI